MGFIIPVSEEDDNLCVEQRRESFTIYQGQGYNGDIEINTRNLRPLIAALLEVDRREQINPDQSILHMLESQQIDLLKWLAK